MSQLKKLLEEYFTKHLKDKFSKDPFRVKFQGLGHFKTKVVFAQVNFILVIDCNTFKE